MGVSAYALITLAELKAFPGMSSVPSSQEAMLEALIDGVSDDFEAWWDNAGVQREFTERYTYGEIRAGAHDADIIWLRKYPVVSVKSITDQADNEIDSDDYWIDIDRGALRTTGWIIPQDAAGWATYWTIVYTAGRAATTAAIPAGIKLAAKMRVAQMWRNPTQDLASKSVGDLSLSYRARAADEGLPPAIARMIACWKRRDV